MLCIGAQFSLATSLPYPSTCVGLCVGLCVGTDTCVSYEEEDTCVSYEEEDTCVCWYCDTCWRLHRARSHTHTHVFSSHMTHTCTLRTGHYEAAPSPGSPCLGPSTPCPTLVPLMVRTISVYL